jgi:hypothetical protein
MALTSHSQALRAPTPHDRKGASSALRSVALLFLVGFVLHNADHFRRGLDVLTPAVFWAGTLSGLVSLATIAFVLMNNGRLSAPFATVVGFSMAVGVSVVHLLPGWSALSDSLPDGGVDVVTWVAVLCEIAGAFAFGWVGWRMWRGRPRKPQGMR